LRALTALQHVAIPCQCLGLEVVACHYVCGWVWTGMGMVWGICEGGGGKKSCIVGMTCCEHAGPTTPTRFDVFDSSSRAKTSNIKMQNYSFIPPLGPPKIPGTIKPMQRCQRPQLCPPAHCPRVAPHHPAHSCVAPAMCPPISPSPPLPSPSLPSPQWPPPARCHVQMHSAHGTATMHRRRFQSAGTHCVGMQKGLGCEHRCSLG
jgi:hypothetical protein